MKRSPTPESRETLATLERLLARDAVSVHAAIQAAYQLGKFDGNLEMASVGIQKLEEIVQEPSLPEQRAMGVL